MGRDNGSGMLSAHAGDASAFVQRTCVVGTRPLLSMVRPAPGSGVQLLHLPLALEATRGLSTQGRWAPTHQAVLARWPCQQVRPESQTLVNSWTDQASFYGLQLLQFGGAGSRAPHGFLFCGLDAQLWLTHSFMGLSAYPGTEVRRLCVIRK